MTNGTTNDSIPKYIFYERINTYIHTYIHKYMSYTLYRVPLLYRTDGEQVLTGSGDDFDQLGPVSGSLPKLPLQ